jgi:hypothetical protein
MKDRKKIMGARADATTTTARAIVDAEKNEHEAKTARLRAARLAKEALEPPPAKKPRSRPRRWP